MRNLRRELAALPANAAYFVPSAGIKCDVHQVLHNELYRTDISVYMASCRTHVEQRLRGRRLPAYTHKACPREVHEAVEAHMEHSVRG